MVRPERNGHDEIGVPRFPSLSRGVFLDDDSDKSPTARMQDQINHYFSGGDKPVVGDKERIAPASPEPEDHPSPGDGSGSSRVAQEFEAAIARVRATVAEAKVSLLKQVQEEFDSDLQFLVGPVADPIPQSKAVDAEAPQPSIDTPSPRVEAAPLLPIENAAASGSEPPQTDGTEGLDAIEPMASEAPPSPEDSTPSRQPTDGDLYEGTVKLSVKVSEGSREVLRFVDELCKKPQVRLLRLVGNQREGLELRVGLREPMYLKSMLQGMTGVYRVSDLPGGGSKAPEPHLEVRFVKPPSLN